MATKMSSSTPSNSPLSYEKHNVAGLALFRPPEEDLKKMKINFETFSCLLQLAFKA